MRAPATYAKALQKHQARGAFLHFLACLQKITPGEMWADVKLSLENQFQQGYLDPDLLHVLETEVLAGDLKGVGAFRRGFGFQRC